MGETRVKHAKSSKQIQTFEKRLLGDVFALERMLEEGWFEIDTIRVGAEQEFCLVDKHWKPSTINMQMIENLDLAYFTTELAKFNLEINATPRVFEGNCLSSIENEISKLLADARQLAHSMDADIVLSGILPTIRKFDVNTENITPLERYYALCEAINKLRGSKYELRINGIDELQITHDSPLLEGANTGFQVHLQVRPDEFVNMYNISQAITAPVLSVATNSPILFGKRLWKETRVALFQQSVDTRSTSDHLRDISPRVTFGDDWLRGSIMDIYREDIVKYRVLLSAEVTENVMEKLKSGTTPDLMALKVHNSTVYRWNRPCYGISNGKAHLRIENRILPAGPTVVDEMANAAFWLGLMIRYNELHPNIHEEMDFSDARSNFVAASRNGLDSNFHWINGAKVNTADLILSELLPIAHEGLQKMNVSDEDRIKYLEVIEERVKTRNTGANWILRSYSKLIKDTGKEEALTAITAATAHKQALNDPVHNWHLASLDDLKDWSPNEMLVEECMTRDLVTIQRNDIVQLAAEMMDWKKVRYIPVENDQGKLIGLISSRMILNEYNKIINHDKKAAVKVADIMIPIEKIKTISPNAKILDAMKIMRSKQIGCLPVISGERLIGIVTEQDFLMITKRLIERLEKIK